MAYMGPNMVIGMTINLPGFPPGVARIASYYLVMSNGDVLERSQRHIARTSPYFAHLVSGLQDGSILILRQVYGEDCGLRSNVDLYNVALSLGVRDNGRQRAVDAICRRLLPRMLSQYSGSDCFSPDPHRRLQFWSLVHVPGMIAPGEVEEFMWLIQACRQRYYGGATVSYQMTAEDLLEHLSRDTWPVLSDGRY